MEEMNKFQEEQEKYRQMLPNYNPQYNIYDYRVGFGRRFAAALIDIVLVIIISSIIGVVFGFLPEIESFSLQNLMDPIYMEELQKGFLPFSLLITFIYYSMEIFFQATPGKMLLGIVIADESMKFATNGQLIARFLLKHLDSVIQVVYVFTWFNLVNSIAGLVSLIIIGAFLFCLASSKQSIYDRMTRTAIYFKSEIQQASSTTNEY